MAFIPSKSRRVESKLSSSYLVSALLFLLAALAFSNTLSYSAFIRDDRYIISENPLLQSWNSLPTLLTTGYWEGAVGSGAPVQEFRPLLMLSYALTALPFGFIPWMFHLTNLLVHAANVLLLFLLLKRRYPYEIAAGASALFAVLPVHVEAVTYLCGRSELLVCFFVLLSWLELERTKPRALLGFLWFVCALLSKEQAVLFPIVLAADDWVVHGRPFWKKERRSLYTGLVSCAIVYLTMRFFVLANPFHGGADYFQGKPYLIRLLTMARFALDHYAWPLLTGLGLQSEFIRPFFPDAQQGDPTAWLFLGIWAALLSAALVQFLRRRSSLAFWILTGFVWISPVSNLIIKLDTIGAERFLYLPSIGVCIILAQQTFHALTRHKKAAILVLALLAAWYGTLSFLRNRVWATDMSYYKQAVQDNPYSAGAHSGLGVALLGDGDRENAERSFWVSAELNHYYAPAFYNLGKIYFEKGDLDKAENYFKTALARGIQSVDTWIFLGRIEEQRGHLPAAIDRYERALSYQPWNSMAHFNLARLYMMRGQKTKAQDHFERFLELSPNDPAAPAVRQLTQRLKDQPTGVEWRMEKDKKS